jgi:uncharacterized protein
MDTKDCSQLELKAVTEAGEFEGLAAVYDIIDEGGDCISRGAFTKTLSEGSAELPLLWQHDQRQPIGRVRLTDTPKGLMAHGRLAMSVPEAQKAYTLMKEGIVRGLSIGYRAIKEQMTGAVRRLKEIRLFEVSVVTLPMAPSALITNVKAQPHDTEMLEAFRSAARDIRDFYSQMFD